MPRLEELSSGVRVRGLAPQGVATVKHVEWQGEACVEVFYLDERGLPQQAILFRHDEPNLTFETATRPWSFDADGDLLRLVSEAYRIQLAWLFDPYLAISTSSIQPLPHQISAVYETMLHGARDLAYRLYSVCDRRGWAEDARAYNGLVVAWPELEKLARGMAAEPAQDSPVLFDLGGPTASAGKRGPRRGRKRS